MATEIGVEANFLLEQLREHDDLAAELRVRVRGREAVFLADFGEDDEEPVFRLRLRDGALHLDVRQKGRWAATPEHGMVEELARLLTGPLRFVWHLHAEDARDSRERG